MKNSLLLLGETDGITQFCAATHINQLACQDEKPQSADWV